MTEATASDMTSARVAVTGVGIVSPLGSSLAEVIDAFATGRPGAALPGAADGPFVVPHVPLEIVPDDKRSRLGRMDRLCQFLLAASYQAVDAAGLCITDANRERVGVSFGTGLGCLLTDAEYNQRIVERGPGAASPRLFTYTVSSAAAGEVSIAFGIKGPNVTAHMGLAAGLGAVGYGVDLIQRGKADVVLAGGADVIGPAIVRGLTDMGLLKTRAQMAPFRDAIPGVCPAEGAIVVLLERRERARARRARAWGCIDGYAAGFEPTLTRRRPETTGVAATMRRALQRSRRTPAEIGIALVSAHGTPLDDTERRALVETFGAESDLILLAPKGRHGDSFGASGPLSLALAAGLLDAPRPLADGLTYAIDGSARGDGAVRERLETAPAVLVNALCYTGNTVTLVFSGGQGGS